MVLTLPEYRGRGYARVLMQHALNHLSGTTVRLDASDMGRPLYESLGFVAECPVERWRREPSAGVTAPEVGPVEIDVSYDAQVFGATRAELLRDLAREGGVSVSGGYALARPGSNAAFFGPWVAESTHAAESLLRGFLAQRGDGASVIDLFPHHKQAVALASAFGYRPFRKLTRMVLSPAPVQLPDPRIFGIAGFEWG
jgi:hypothetical protein